MVDIPPEAPKPPTPALKPVQQTVIELQIQYKGPRARDMQQVARNKLASSNGSGSSNYATVEAMHLSQYSRDVLALGLPKHLVVWQPAASHCIWNPGVIICEWRVPEDSAFRRHLRAIAACTFDPKCYEDVMNRHCISCIRYKENGSMLKERDFYSSFSTRTVPPVNEANRSAWDSVPNTNTSVAQTSSSSSSLNSSIAAPVSASGPKRKNPPAGESSPQPNSKRIKPTPSTPINNIAPEGATVDTRLKLIQELQEKLQKTRRESYRLSDILRSKEKQISDLQDEQSRIVAAAEEKERAISKDYALKSQMLIEEHIEREKALAGKVKRLDRLERQAAELQDALNEANRTRRTEHADYERLQQHASFLEENNRRQTDTISVYRKRDEDASIARQYEDDAKRLGKEEIETERRRYSEQLAALRAQVASLQSMKDPALLDEALKDRLHFQQLYETEKAAREKSDTRGRELGIRYSEVCRAKKQVEETLAEERREHEQLEQAFTALQKAGISVWAVPAMAEAILRIGQLTNDSYPPSE